MNENVIILEADRPRVLKATHSALEMAEKLTGIKLKDSERWMESFENLRKVAFAFCVRDARLNGEKLTLDKMADILDEVESESAIVEAVAAAIEAAFPDTTKNPKAAVTQEK